MNNAVPFEITEVYRVEVERLLSSRSKSKVIHSSGDIDASGDELELPFRDLLRRRLPNQYFVGHGHIVDSALNVSPQFDVIIADNNGTPILFEAENGCQYFPYESVYAVGEIKSSYFKAKKPIRRFAKNIAKLKKELNRLATPATYLTNGISLGDGLSSSDSRSVRNPLFQFSVFFDSGNSTRTALADEFISDTDPNLPAVSVFLDGKVIVKAELVKVGDDVAMGVVDLDPVRALGSKDTHWMHVDYRDPRKAGAQALVVLMLGLFDHLNRCVLMAPRISNYLAAVLREAPNNPNALSQGGILKMTELLGGKIPPEVTAMLERRAAGGKSMLHRFTETEVADLLKAEKSTADLLPSGPPQSNESTSN